MKIAIPIYADRVAPRFRYCRKFLVIELKNKQEQKREELTLDIEDPIQIAEILARAGVDQILSGGMNSDFQREFRLRNIGVIWGLIGEAEDVLAAYLKGKVFAGMGPCPPSTPKPK